MKSHGKCKDNKEGDFQKIFMGFFNINTFYEDEVFSTEWYQLTFKFIDSTY